MISFFRQVAVSTLWLALFAVSAEGAAVQAAVASNMKSVFASLEADFHRTRPDVELRASYGASGNFFGQIKNGAPFDIFFSADALYPEKLAAAGLGLAGAKPIPYASGALALWMKKHGGASPRVHKMDLLREPWVKKIAIANPKLAPYGRAAEEALLYYRLYEDTRERLVFGETAGQAAQFAESGAAQAGIIALSLALAPPMQTAGSHWELPPESHGAITQSLLLLGGGKNPRDAAAFAAYALSPDGQNILQRHGFRPPPQNP